MTTILVDAKTQAVYTDSLACSAKDDSVVSGGFNKYFIPQDKHQVVAGTGLVSDLLKCQDRWTRGKRLPKKIRGSFLVFTNAGEEVFCREYNHNKWKEFMIKDYHAFGSGSHYAMGAMAVRPDRPLLAMKVAIKHDKGTGGKIHCSPINRYTDIW